MTVSRIALAVLGTSAISFLALSALLFSDSSSLQVRSLLHDDFDFVDHHSRHAEHDEHRGPEPRADDDGATAIDVSSTSVDDDDDDDKVEADCGFFKSHWELRKKLVKVVCGRKDSGDCGSRNFPGITQSNGGFGTNMWATIVNRAGRVCAVAYSGEDFDDQWLGARVISAQKAYAANAFSLDGYALSTANLYGVTQQGKSLSGLVDANPVDAHDAYLGYIRNWGESCTDEDDDDGEDPFCGKRIGGVNTFGGGLALYDKHGDKKGGLGVSGDTSCADHVIAWKLRNELDLDYVPAGPTGAAPGDDQIKPVVNCGTDQLAGNQFCHPYCGFDNSAAVTGAYDAIIAGLPPVRRH